jgi:phage baseplate assembly protein W
MITQSIYSDIDMNLNRQGDGDIRIDNDIQAVFNALENIVMTIQGSRRMRPDFAYGPHNFLFEAITEENAIGLGNLLVAAIEAYEDRIDLTNIHVDYDQYNNLYRPTISFSMKGKGSDIVESVSFILKRL